MKTIEIPSSIDLLVKQRDHIIDSIEKLKIELLKLDQAIFVLGGTNKQVELPLNISNNQVTQEKAIERKKWKKPIYEVLKKENRLLLNREIVKLIYPNATDDEIGKLVIEAAGALHGLTGKEIIKGWKKEGIKGYLFGLSNWFDGNIPKREYIR